jgi:putative transposase
VHGAPTVVLKLRNPTRGKRARLDALQVLFNGAVQLGLDSAIELATSSRAKIHNDSYARMRELGLPSDYARMAVNGGVALARSYYGRKAKRRVSFPTAPRDGIGLGVNAYTIQNGSLRISTGVRGAYIWVPLCVPAKYRDRLQHVRGDAKLFMRDADWFVMLPLREPVTPAVRDGDETVLGVDLGVVRLMSVKTPDGVVQWNGKAVRRRKEHFADLRRRYQRNRRTDRVRAQKGKERRRQQSVNHKLSRELVDIATMYPNAVIAFEKLDGIRERVRGSKRFNRLMSGWAFRDLVDKVRYKAVMAGIELIFVDPRGTSTTCSKCGHATRSNRQSQCDFRCLACGYTANADANAAINIAAVALEALRQGATDTPRPARVQVGRGKGRPDGVKVCASVHTDSNLASSSQEPPHL